METLSHYLPYFTNSSGSLSLRAKSVSPQQGLPSTSLLISLFQGVSQPLEELILHWIKFDTTWLGNLLRLFSILNMLLKAWKIPQYHLKRQYRVRCCTPIVSLPCSYGIPPRPFSSRWVFRFIQRDPKRL